MLMRDRATVNRMASHAALGGCRSRAESTDGIGGRFGFNVWSTDLTAMWSTCHTSSLYLGTQ